MAASKQFDLHSYKGRFCIFIAWAIGMVFGLCMGLFSGSTQPREMQVVLASDIGVTRGKHDVQSAAAAFSVAPTTTDQAKIPQTVSKSGDAGFSSPSSMSLQLSPILVVAIIPINLSDFSRRAIMRATFAELTSGIFIGLRPVEVIVRFMVGRPVQGHSDETRQLVNLQEEEQRHGDIVRIDVAEGSVRAARAKSWHVFNWTVVNIPEASLIFKQDYDTMVDWRVLLPRIVSVALGIAIVPDKQVLADDVGKSAKDISPEGLRHLFFGRKHNAFAHCASGALYGLSRDVARWVSENRQQLDGREFEDMAVCKWVNDFEKMNGFVRRKGLLKPRDFSRNATIHNLKKDNLYVACFENRILGCDNGRAHGADDYEFFRLPSPAENAAFVQSAALASTILPQHMKSQPAENAAFVQSAALASNILPQHMKSQRQSLLVVTSGSLASYTGKSTMERVIKPNSAAGFDVDYLLGLNSDPPNPSGKKNCEPAAQDPTLAGLSGFGFKQTVCDGVHRNGGAHCSVELFEPLGLNATSDVKDVHRSTLEHLWRTGEIWSFLHQAKILSLLWSGAEDLEQKRGYNYTHVMYVHDSAYWFADGLADALNAPLGVAEANGPGCSLWGGINARGMLLTREAAARFLPFHEVFLHDTSSDLASTNTEQFFRKLLKLKGIRYETVDPEWFPTILSMWTQPKGKDPSLCITSQDCMPPGFPGAHPPVCCV